MKKKKPLEAEITSETPQEPPFDALVIMEGKDGHCTQVLILRGLESLLEADAFLSTFNKTILKSRSLKKIPFGKIRTCSIGREPLGVPRDPVKAARWWMKYLLRELEAGRWVIER